MEAAGFSLTHVTLNPYGTAFGFSPGSQHQSAYRGTCVARDMTPVCIAFHLYESEFNDSLEHDQSATDAWMIIRYRYDKKFLAKCALWPITA
jgi:hypothetical protein